MESVLHGLDVFMVVTEYADYIKCKRTRLDVLIEDVAKATVGDSVSVNIAKPFALRRSLFDVASIGGAAVDGWTHIFTSSNARTRVEGDYPSSSAAQSAIDAGTHDTEIQILNPYARGETILAVQRPVFVSAALSCRWEDVNAAGRAWRQSGVQTTVVADIAAEVGAGVYTWTLALGAGPASGSATELNLSTGIIADTRVVLHLVAGAWYFFFPVEECA